MDFKELKLRADEFIDSEEFILSGELYLLKKVFEAASDVKKAKQWEEFRDHNPNTEKCLIDAVSAMELYLSEFDHPE